MKPLRIIFSLLFCLSIQADEGKPLTFQEVFQLIKTNISDLSEGELNHSAAVGLIKEMGTRVQLVTTNGESAAQAPDAVSKRAVFEESYGYVRVKSVDERLPVEFQRSLTELIKSNDLKGVIVDLRYASGTNYEAAAKVVDHFVSGGEFLLRFGGREIKATDESRAVRLPAAVLVNHETRAAAEAIAAMMKESAAALVVGEKTAGEARLFETFTLTTGQKLRIGKVPVEVANKKVIPADGIHPDIKVGVDPDEEKLFYLDPYRERRSLLPASGTNEVASVTNRIRRMNEAELVRRHREGIDFSEEPPAPPAETPVITDPALARAIDVLKGVAILQPRKPL